MQNGQQIKLFTLYMYFLKLWASSGTENILADIFYHPLFKKEMYLLWLLLSHRQISAKFGEHLGATRM